MFSPVSKPNIFYDTKNIRSFFMTKSNHLKNLRTFVIKKEPYCCDDMYRAGKAQPYKCIIKRKSILGVIEIDIIEDKIKFDFNIVWLIALCHKKKNNTVLIKLICFLP